MTRRRIPCTLSSRVIGSSSHSGFLGRTSTLGKIGQMALLFVHGKCQHYYESGQPRAARAPRRGPKELLSTTENLLVGLPNWRGLPRASTTGICAREN